ncbi:MAG: formyl transferase [Chitinophagaceae bacterium]|nr:MAG: formyl transferase [Chitinophagaceae bacterium]
MKGKRIVLLAGKWDTTPIVYNFLTENLSVLKAIIEEPVSRKDFLKKRAKKLGWRTVVGQVLFSAVIAKPLQQLSKKRIAAIVAGYQLNTKPIPLQKISAVGSVNDEGTIAQLQQLAPDLVIVHGTRIIAKKVLHALPAATFINIHAGITPRYRGSHGAYWALANHDEANCGVTVHLVDTGIDTGNILAQSKIPLTAKDNFATYPYLQLAVGLKLLKTVLEQWQRGVRPAAPNTLNSSLWHHPTIWSYVWKRFTKGVK